MVRSISDLTNGERNRRMPTQVIPPTQQLRQCDVPHKMAAILSRRAKLMADIAESLIDEATLRSRCEHPHMCFSRQINDHHLHNWQVITVCRDCGHENTTIGHPVCEECIPAEPLDRVGDDFPGAAQALEAHPRRYFQTPVPFVCPKCARLTILELRGD